MSEPDEQHESAMEEGKLVHCPDCEQYVVRGYPHNCWPLAPEEVES